MVFISGTCRLEMSVENDNVRLEISKGDEHQVHLIPLYDYAALLRELGSFNKDIEKEIRNPKIKN